VLVGTVFENTKYPLRDWFRVIHMILTSKKGVSALEVHRVIGQAAIARLGACAIASAPGWQRRLPQAHGHRRGDETYIGGKAYISTAT